MRRYVFLAQILSTLALQISGVDTPISSNLLSSGLFLRSINCIVLEALLIA